MPEEFIIGPSMPAPTDLRQAEFITVTVICFSVLPFRFHCVRCWRQCGVNMKLTTFCPVGLEFVWKVLLCNHALCISCISQALPSQCRRKANSEAKSRRGGGFAVANGEEESRNVVCLFLFFYVALFVFHRPFAGLAMRS